MKWFFLLVEFTLPIIAVYWVVKKQSLSIVYIPFIMFSYHIIETKLPGFFMYFILILLLLYFVIYNLPFVMKNIFSLIIFFYFMILLMYVDDLKEIRPYLVNVSWLFLGIALIPQIYGYFSREKIFKEISYAAFLVMGIFSINTILSTIFKYNPREIYGISKGILFGNISNDYYNIFPLALYLILRRAVRDKNIVFFVVYFVSIFFVLLTLRRSVMLLSVLATVIVLIELLDFKNIKQFVIYGLFIFLISLVVISKTTFLQQLTERYEGRNIKDKSLEDEGRMMEIKVMYKDLFVYYDYNPWFGYGLEQSPGNYGKGIFGTRSLHTDFAHLIHASGFLGLFLYLLMIGFAFFIVWKRTFSKTDKLQFFFILLCFSIYFINGRYTTVNSMLMMFGILNLPLGKGSSKEKILLKELNPEKLPV
jgi:O-antigen ligase